MPTTTESPLIRKKEVDALFTSRAIVQKLEEGGHLKPILRQPRVTLYRRADVMAVLTKFLQRPTSLVSTPAKREGLLS